MGKNKCQNCKVHYPGIETHSVCEICGHNLIVNHDGDKAHTNKIKNYGLAVIFGLLAIMSFEVLVLFKLKHNKEKDITEQNISQQKEIMAEKERANTERIQQEEQERAYAENLRQAKERSNAERIREEEKANEIRRILGDEIPCHVFTSFVEIPGISERLRPATNGDRFSNIRTFINRNNGTITIFFDYDITKPLSIAQFLVRVFDRNGKYLEHFVTAERFSTDDTTNNPNNKYLEHFTATSPLSIKLKDLNNILQYSINMRDASFAEQVEFGLNGVEGRDLSQIINLNADLLVTP